MLSVSAALNLIQQTVSPASPTRIPLSQVNGAFLADALVADVDSPPFDKSLMDGFAVRAEQITGPGVQLPVCERLTAGEVPSGPLPPGKTVRVMTGTRLPAGTDAVIPVEQVTDPEADTIEIQVTSIAAGRNIMRQGESMRVGETVLQAGERLSFPQIGILAELGHAAVSVYPIPEVAILATGNELVPVDQTPGPGEIRNTNEPMLLSQIQSCGATPRPLGIGRDEPAELKAKIEQGLTSDFLILSGGVSAGVLDLVPSILAQCGVQEVFHKVHLKPGKPIWFGHKPATATSSECYVFGLPGNPVSSLVCFELFVKPALRRFQGSEGCEPLALQAELTQPHLVKGDRPVYYPARWQVDGLRLTAQPVRWMGSADLRGVAAANGMIHFSPRNNEYQVGELVPLYVWGTDWPTTPA